MTLQTKLFIAGEWVDSSDGGQFDVADPATTETVTAVANATLEDADHAVDAAAAAFPGWAATPMRERGELLRAVFEKMIERTDEVARLISLENGKVTADAIGEVRYAAEFLRWFSEEAVRGFGRVGDTPSGLGKIVVMNQPVGVSLLITPWNFPAAMMTRKVGPALAAGCTVVVKPASDTPLTALWLADLFHECGAPPGVVNVTPSRRSGPFAERVLADDRVRKLSFTGSTEVGKDLLALAARRVVNNSMELGGNAPFVVMNDADMEATVTGAIQAKMRSSGAACVSANRFYVQRKAHDEFVDRFTKAMAELRVGPATDPDAQVGPLVNERERDRVADLVDGAVSRGVTVTTGGERLNRTGWYYSPTVLADVKSDDPLLREEIFGPVAPIVVFDDLDEAVALANDTDMGLIAYAFTENLRTGLNLAERLDAGMVGLNRGFISDPAAPFGGTKQSGIGREGGYEGLMEFIEPKYVGTNW
ncbi:MAG: NAD-dependent succinate-semialdehyde dehydrogenase [Pseudomonadota bacterium]